MATKKKKASTKKTATKKKTRKTAGRATKSALAATSIAAFTGAPLVPNDTRATANTALVTTFSGLSSYWNLLRPETFYRVVVARAVSKAGATLTFDLINPATGASSKTNMEVDLEDGANTYPYFPSSLQQYAGGSARFGYLLLSEEYLEAHFSPETIAELAGPKVPLLMSL